MNKYRAVLCILLFFLLVLASSFSLLFVSQEHTLHYWDSATYYNMSLQLADMYRYTSLKGTAASVYTSLGYDYNFLPILLPSFFLLFSPTRSAYILANTLLYFFPWAVMTAVLCNAFLVRKIEGRWHSLYIPLLTYFALLLPTAWQPLLFGFPDILVVCIALIILFLTKNSLTQATVKRTFAVGVLLILMIALRRYFAYWALPFSIYLICENIFFVLREERSAEIYRAVRNTVVLIASMLFSMPFFGRNFIAMLVRDYGNIYLPYQNNESPLTIVLNIFFRWNSPCLSVFCLVVLYILIKKKTHRSFIIRLSVVSILAGVLFAHTQSFGPQHYYLFLPLVSILFLFGVQLVSTLRYRPTRIILSALIGILSAASMALTFTPLRFHPSVAQSPLLPVVAPFAFMPPQRENMQHIQALCTQLEALDLTNKKVYVLASSHLLNRDLFSAGCPKQLLSQVSAVDTRDGFPESFFTADAIITTTPVQLHLDYDGECAVWCLRDMFLTDLQPLYQEVWAGMISDGVSVHVSLRTSSIPEPIQDRLRQKFDEHMIEYSQKR